MVTLGSMVRRKPALGGLAALTSPVSSIQDDGMSPIDGGAPTLGSIVAGQSPVPGSTTSSTASDPNAPPVNAPDINQRLLPTGALQPVSQPSLPGTVGHAAKHHRSFKDVAGDLGALLLAASGNPAGRMLLGDVLRQREEKQRDARQEAMTLAQWNHDQNVRNADRRFKASQPQYFTAGNDRVAYNPMTGQSDVLYHGSQPFEDYASALGLNPGTPEYTTALQDYVLRGNGPTAYGYDLDLEGARQRNRIALRQTPSYAQTHPGASHGGRPTTLAGTIAPILAKVARGETLTPGEQTALDTYYRRDGKSGHGGGSSGKFTKVATNPQTGEKVGWNGTAWVPIQ